MRCNRARNWTRAVDVFRFWSELGNMKILKIMKINWVSPTGFRTVQALSGYHQMDFLDGSALYAVPGAPAGTSGHWKPTETNGNHGCLQQFGTSFLFSHFLFSLSRSLYVPLFSLVWCTSVSLHRALVYVFQASVVCALVVRCSHLFANPQLKFTVGASPL